MSGGLLLQQVERITGIVSQFAGCFTDHRDPDLIEHTVENSIAQRIHTSNFLSKCMKISGGFVQPAATHRGEHHCDVESLSVVPN